MKRSIKVLACILVVVVALAVTACGGGSAGKVAPANAYRVITVDESGAPVKGVAVQMCSDTMCIQGETDGKGIALFEGLEEGAYTVHVTEAPEGFAEDATEYEMPKTYGDLTITLKAA